MLSDIKSAFDELVQAWEDQREVEAARDQFNHEHRPPDKPTPIIRIEALIEYETVSTNYYVLKHLLGSILGLVFAIFGAFALRAYLANGRAGRLGLVGMVITVLGSALSLTIGGASAFAAPKEGQVYLAGIEEFAKLPPSSRIPHSRQPSCWSFRSCSWATRS